jgi:Sec-independent protein translocase protein TatA
MFVATVILILLGALLSLFTAVRALGAYLRFRRARATFQSEVTEEIDRLAARADELEKNLSALDARASELPIQISELQQNLHNLQVLTRTLGATLRQVQRVLSFNALKTLSADRIGRMARNASIPKKSSTS